MALLLLSFCTPRGIRTHLPVVKSHFVRLALGAYLFVPGGLTDIYTLTARTLFYKDVRVAPGMGCQGGLEPTIERFTVVHLEPLGH